MPISTSDTEASDIKVGGREIRTWNDQHFKKIRGLTKIPENFLEELDWKSFKPGGGKGGDLMAFTKCKRWLVKETNPGDHKSLLKVTEAYCSHVTTGPTLLSPFVLHFVDSVASKVFLVMCNCLYTPMIKDVREFDATYDLKGCNDDKFMSRDGHSVKAIHKRIWNIHMWLGKCTWSEARKDYYQSKLDARNLHLPLEPGPQSQIAAAIKRDCEKFLSVYGLMDYSLVLGHKQLPQEFSEGEHAEAFAAAQTADRTKIENWDKPLVRPFEGGWQLIGVGLIDFLQEWTPIKKIAQCVKVAERNKATIPPGDYAKRFAKHFTECVFENAEDQKAREARGETRSTGANSPKSKSPKKGNDGKFDPIEATPKKAADEVGETTPKKAADDGGDISKRGTDTTAATDAEEDSTPVASKGDESTVPTAGAVDTADVQVEVAES